MDKAQCRAYSRNLDIESSVWLGINQLWCSTISQDLNHNQGATRDGDQNKSDNVARERTSPQGKSAT
ncbi:hypothetical protein QWZ16_20940 [Vibrio ostreicida]|uniref:Uncharacterized protein n=1 Tax=Vibrio ostreicida TaxID=526588 RepID=A0ABT8BYF4_9VIBR|nr:hypothetical protein [Vibrio ostreicida]MDN3612063.1 hypothetical protein [Vibrio ostreicida]